MNPAANSIDSGTSTTHRTSFFDEDGNPAVPSQVFVSVLSISPPAIVRAETQITDTMAAVMDFVVTAAENTVLSLPIETRRLVVRSTYLSGQLVTHFNYQLRQVIPS